MYKQRSKNKEENLRRHFSEANEIKKKQKSKWKSTTDRGVRPRQFKTGDLVLKTVNVKTHAMHPTNESTFRILNKIRPGTYNVADMDGRVVVNADKLKLFNIGKFNNSTQQLGSTRTVFEKNFNNRMDVMAQ
ncbi:hypothetical protein BB561_001694 [Smittium simulii]|uniref:Uncharacterized protein n=1 Tax=Smittium simulii TaxID=133385 RepID=A0A2T9YTD7_9FUNG|nr:hypothetical protein BB561_001694 [Smittium simulii]